MTDQSQTSAEATGLPAGRADRPYDMRRLSYAGTFRNPLKSGSIRAIEWLTAKVQLLRLIRSFEKSGAPFGAPFWPKAIRHMGIRIDTPPEEIARIPATGPVVVVANHPSGLVDGMVMAEMVCRVRSDFKILTRSLLTGIPEVEEFMIPVPFPHEDNARELGLQMRDETMKHLKAGGVIIIFPAGKVAMSPGWFDNAVEAEWNVFTHKMVRSSGATIVPIFFPGQNSRAFLIANKLSDTLRQGLLLYEIKRALFKPQRPVIGEPIPAEELKKWEGNPRGFLAWLREHTLSLGKSL
ncbi:lysophospholipid acyltransferase family protein [Xinfangfangia sp. CPCC 101601]|uniref:Lysophospholipid acyltransferase family protein n=1 Tax=Pseudogemmobacter lacusdianii TaxID=3069608 RepID=A0ABU0VXE7_9RHOB|nr:lysophospholipid acyltransferase family protein [Xinfangfangia sp. CPCC 101601]MDQ2066407.1 lysophospholipid acyltransferase family protein [Xinfangfangia sp. CPCC 101601]